MRSAAHLESFWIKQDLLISLVSNVLGVYRGMRVWSHASYAEAWIRVLCAVDVFTKYALVKPLKDTKAKTIVHGFK